MLEKSIEQSLDEPRPIKLDIRSCDDLGQEVVRAADCNQQFACEDCLPKLELLHERCPNSEQKPMKLGVAAAELAIRQGAGQTPEPILVEPEPAELRDVPLGLAAGKGAVLRVCGKRARDLASYLDLRRECVGGEVVVAQSFPAGSHHELRVGIFEHPSDGVWVRRWPTLLVTGEREHHEQAAAANLKSRLDDLLRQPRQSADAQRAWRDVLRAFGEFAPSLARSPVLAQTLSEEDGALVPWFAELGRRKRQAKTEGVKPLERYAYGNRALALPLADLGADGAVEIGAQNRGADFDLGLALPRSLAAYRAELERTVKHGVQKPGDAKTESALREIIRSLGSSCRKAIEAAQQAERASVECGFNPAACAAERRQELGRELDLARKEAEPIVRGSTLGIASLPAASRPEQQAGDCPR
jgi:hypothetical protein